MSVYREYIEVTDAPGGPFTATVRMCHDFPLIQPNAGNQVAIFDERVAALMGEEWDQGDMPTDTMAVLAC